jgi:hypothetical protein
MILNCRLDLHPLIKLIQTDINIYFGVSAYIFVSTAPLVTLFCRVALQPFYIFTIRAKLSI